VVLLGRGRQAQLVVGGAGGGVERAAVEVGQPIQGARAERAETAARVVHEIAADQVAVVAQSRGRDIVGQQQQPCVLDAAGGEHEVAGSDVAAAPVGGADQRTADRRCVVERF